jgi:hypothetical protein
MPHFATRIASLAATAALLLAAEPLAAEPYPLEYWALRDVVSNVQCRRTASAWR